MGCGMREREGSDMADRGQDLELGKLEGGVSLNQSVYHFVYSYVKVYPFHILAILLFERDEDKYEI